MTETTKPWHAKVGDDMEFQKRVLAWLAESDIDTQGIVSITHEPERGPIYLIDRYAYTDEGKIALTAAKTAAREVERVSIGVPPPLRP